MTNEAHDEDPFGDDFWGGEITQLEEDFLDVDAAVAPGDIPDASYIVVVDSASMSRTRNTNDPMLRWGLRIASGAHEGATLDRTNLIASRQNLSWLKRDLKVCGIELASLKELPRRCRELIGLKLRVTKRTRGDYANIFIDELIGQVEKSEEEDEDVPF